MVVMKKILRNLLEKFLLTRGLTLTSIKHKNFFNLKALTIPGWFTSAECESLYKTTMLINGPILEIGHFLGRSTACICEALYDSKKNRRFNSYDLGFTSAEEFKKFYDQVHKRDVKVPHLFEQVYAENMTSTAMAMKNLQSLGLEGFVNLISGDFIELDREKYDFIFCDAMHDVHEIKLNLPHIISHSNNHCIWAFHDMRDENIDAVLRLSNSKLIDRAHSLGTFIHLG